MFAYEVELAPFKTSSLVDMITSDKAGYFPNTSLEILLDMSTKITRLTIFNRLMQFAVLRFKHGDSNKDYLVQSWKMRELYIANKFTKLINWREEFI